MRGHEGGTLGIWVIDLDRGGTTLVADLSETFWTTPTVLWPANHMLREVTATATASDNLSTVFRVTRLEVLSNEPDNGLGDGDLPNGIQGLTPSLVTAGRLRAERSGKGSGRQYSIVFTVVDEAGNSGTCTAYVKVPHDQGNGTGRDK